MSDLIIDITPEKEPQKISFIKRITTLLGRYIGVTIAVIIMIGLAGWTLFLVVSALWPFILLAGGIVLFLLCFIVVGNFFGKKKLLDLDTSEEN